jgi:hypothetical protein
VLPETVVVGGVRRAQVLDRKRGRDTNVHRETPRVLPTREGDVSWAAPRPFGVSQDPTLLQNRGEKALIAHPCHQVADAVVAHNDVSVLLAARGVIAAQVKRLHAKRTLNIRACHWQTKAVPNGGPKDRSREDTVRTLKSGRNGGDPGTSVLSDQPA